MQSDMNRRWAANVETASRTVEASVMKAMIRIAMPQLGHASGNTP